MVVFVASAALRPRVFHLAETGLFLPESGLCRLAAHAHNEVKGERSVGVVAEGAKIAHAFYLRVAHLAHPRSTLVAERVAEVDEHVALSCREREALTRRAHGGGHLATDAVLLQAHGVIARRSFLSLIFRTVFATVCLNGSFCRHDEHGTHLRASHATKRDMCEACKKLVGIFVWCRPPLFVLVISVEVAAHDVEGDNAHQSGGHYGAGVTGAEVGGADERVDVVDGRLLCVEQCGQQGQE